MANRHGIASAGLLALALITAVYLSSCIDTASIQRQSLHSNDPYYLSRMYLAELKEGTNSQRAQAAWALGGSIKRTTDVIPALILALNDTSPQVRANAAGALSNIGEEARPAENELRKSLHDSDGRVVLNAAIALRNLNVPDKELVPAVHTVLYDQKGTSRVAAARLLRKMGVRDDESITVLAEVLSDSDEQAQLDALAELNDMKLKPIPKKVSGPVIVLLRDNDENVRMQAALYLGNSYIPVPEAREPLIKTLDDPSGLVVKYAARAVGNYGKSAKGAVPKLYLLITTNPDEGVRGEACEALGHIGEPRRDIAQALVEVLATDTSPEARQGAASGLRILKYRDALVLDALNRAATKDKDASVRTIAGIAYGQLKGKN